MQISVGGAGVSTVSLRAAPGSLGPTGGSTELIALVAGENGAPLEGVSVRYSTDQGTLSAESAVTGQNGEARVTLTSAGCGDLGTPCDFTGTIAADRCPPGDCQPFPPDCP